MITLSAQAWTTAFVEFETRMAAKKKQKSSAPVTSSVEKKMSKAEKKGSETWKRVKTIVHNHVVPPLFLVFFTPIVQVLALKAIPGIPFEWDRY